MKHRIITITMEMRRAHARNRDDFLYPNLVPGMPAEMLLAEMINNRAMQLLN